jgi:hypothetical protein
MRVLFDITAPGWVHFFKHLVWLLEESGHRTLITSRRKDVTTNLLDAYGLEHLCISTKGSGLVGMATELLRRDVGVFGVARRFRADVLVGGSGLSVGPVGRVLHVPSMVLDEAEHATLQRLLGLPFATCVITGSGYLGDLGRRQVPFKGPWVWAYLHPRYFGPDPDLVRVAGVDPDEPYFVVRLISWSAAHDVGLSGAPDADVHRAVERLSQHGRVLLSFHTERPLPSALGQWENPVPVEHVHHLLAHATLVLSEGGTTAAEAGALGVPAIFCNPLRPGYIASLAEDYGLVRTADSLAEGLEVAEELLAEEGLNDSWRGKRRRLERESEDIVKFMFRLVRQLAAGRGPGEL